LKFNIVTENFVGYLRNKGARGEIFGGAEILLYDLCQLILRHGHSVTVIQYGPTSKEFVHDNIPVRQIKAPSFRVLNKVGITRRFHGGGFFWKGHLDKDADRVHFHYYYLGYPYATDSMTGFSHGIDWDCPWLRDSLRYRHVRDRFSFWMMRKLTGEVLKRLKRVVANDFNFQRYVESSYPQYADKIVVVPNYVDSKIFNPRIKPDPHIMERFDGKVKILLPKMPAYERGTDAAIRALAQLRRSDVVLLVVGESTSRRVFEKLARDLQVDDRVFFLGHRDHFSEMPGVYTASDIVIVPSPCREATAFAVLEGMAAGRPVIASNIGGIPEIISTPDVGVLIQPSHGALAKSLEDLLRKPELRTQIADHGCEHVVHTFDKAIWEKRIATALIE